MLRRNFFFYTSQIFVTFFINPLTYEPVYGPSSLLTKFSEGPHMHLNNLSRWILVIYGYRSFQDTSHADILCRIKVLTFRNQGNYKHHYNDVLCDWYIYDGW